MDKDEIFKFLNRPRYISVQLRMAEAELDGLRYSAYPSAIRYDTDRVITSPHDPMPAYAAKVDEIQTRIKGLTEALVEAQDAIVDVTYDLPYLEQEVIVLRYVGRWNWKRIAMDLGKTEDWMFKTHRRAIKDLEKKLSTIERV